MRYVTLICLGALIIIFAAGESTLPLFDNDRELAGRATIAAVVLFAGIGFAFFQLSVWSTFTRHTQRLIKFGGAQGKLADLILHPNFEHRIAIAAKLICATFITASIALAWHLWRNGI